MTIKLSKFLAVSNITFKMPVKVEKNLRKNFKNKTFRNQRNFLFNVHKEKITT